MTIIKTKNAFKMNPVSNVLQPGLDLSSSHEWVTVINPYNRRSLLQACDDCGVVKSENSVAKQCSAVKGAGLISNAAQGPVSIAV